MKLIFDVGSITQNKCVDYRETLGKVGYGSEKIPFNLDVDLAPGLAPGLLFFSLSHFFKCRSKQK